MANDSSETIPTPESARACLSRIEAHVRRTPIFDWASPTLTRDAQPGAQIVAKLEFLQVTGSFKPRGALNCVMRLSEDERRRGITAVSAGNHALAAAYAASIMGVRARIATIRSAPAALMERVTALGAELVLGNDVHEAFAIVARLVQDEGLILVHPFDGPDVADGTATVALEFWEQAGALDALVVAIGGGGLAGGMAALMKQLQPDCRIIGVEPEGADAMRRSFAAGHPITLDKVETIAHSLAPPMTLPYAFGLCRRFVDELVTVSDREMRTAMKLLHDETRMVVEPGGAATVAALTGPLAGQLAGRRIGIVICGANVDLDTFADQIRL